MATGTIEFAASISGIRFEPIEISNRHPAVERIILEAQADEQMTIVVHLTNIFDFEQAIEIGNEILPAIVDRLAFYRDVSIGELRCTGGTLPKDASGSSYSTRTNLALLWANAGLNYTLDAGTRQKLARLLEQPTTRADLYSAYRFALNQHDAAACFMFLYNILLSLNSDSQGQVDNFIRSEEPGVPQYLSGNKRLAAQGVKETIYTRLRNEVSHKRKGTTPEKTRSEIQDNVAAFQELVRTAISQAV